MKEVFLTDKAPLPSDTVSQATISGGTVYVCGQISEDPVTGDVVHGSVAQQTNIALTNLKTILEEAGSCLENVLMVTVYISSMEVFGEFDAEYAKFFPAKPPARATIAVAGIYDHLDVEITCIAALK